MDCELITQGHAVLDSIFMFALSRNGYEHAATLRPPGLQSLYAIHLAAALEVGGDELEAITTYNDRMAEGARSLGIAILAPM